MPSGESSVCTVLAAASYGHEDGGIYADRAKPGVRLKRPVARGLLDSLGRGTKTL